MKEFALRLCGIAFVAIFVMGMQAGLCFASWVTECAPGTAVIGNDFQAHAPSAGGGGGSYSNGDGGGSVQSFTTPSAMALRAPQFTGQPGFYSRMDGLFHPVSGVPGAVSQIASAGSINLSAVGSFFNNPTFSIATSTSGVFSNGKGLTLNSSTGILAARGTLFSTGEVKFDYNGQTANFNLKNALPFNLPAAGVPVIVSMDAGKDTAMGGDNFKDITLGTMGTVSRDPSTGSIVSQWQGTYAGGGTMSMDGYEYMIPSGIGQALFGKDPSAGYLGMESGSQIVMSYQDGALVQIGVDGKVFGVGTQALSAPPVAAGAKEAKISEKAADQGGALQKTTVAASGNNSFKVNGDICDTNFQHWIDITGKPGGTYVLSATSDVNNLQLIKDPAGNIAKTETDAKGNGALITGKINMLGTGDIYVIDAFTGEVVAAIPLGSRTTAEVNNDPNAAPLNVDFSFDRMWQLGYSNPYEALGKEKGSAVTRTYTDMNGQTYFEKDSHSTVSQPRLSEMLCKQMQNGQSVLGGNWNFFGFDPGLTLDDNLENLDSWRWEHGNLVCDYFHLGGGW